MIDTKERKDAPIEPRTSSWWALTSAVVGLLAIGLGIWIASGPENGMLNVFGWSWDLADIPAGIGYALVGLGVLIPGAYSILHLRRSRR